MPTAPYEAKPERWDSLGWCDRSTGEPITGRTHGLLLRRPIKSHPVRTLLTGKAGKKIIQRLTGQVSDESDHRTDYGTRGDRWGLILQVLEELGAGAIIAQGVGSTAHDTLHGARPRAREGSYLAIASAQATASLEHWVLDVPAEPVAQLSAYLRERNNRAVDARRCEWCAKPLPPTARSDARYHSAAYRKAANRSARRDA